MGMFMQKMEQAYPMIRLSERITRNGYVTHMAELKNKRMFDLTESTVPYLEDTISYLQQKGGSIPQRILLVSENEVTALKVAAYMKNHSKDFQLDINVVDFFLYDLDDDDEDEFEEGEGKLKIVPLKLRKPIEHSFLNEYILLMDGIGSRDSVFFTGLLGMYEIREKIEAISVCPASTQYIWIHPNQMQMPWVQDLLLDQQCDVLKLREPKTEYYEGLISYLLEDEPYDLAEDVSPGMLVRMIQKRRGIRFKEEDIAWHFDHAAEEAKTKHPQKPVLEASDFKNLNLSEKKSVDRLNEMIGISNIKEMVSEVAALVHEEMHNKELGVLHKNMLFLGNPGTGKTTCSELLADIMAEAGDTNAVFISVTRKDLIGEYVGQTAPKVAAKFEEARGGVLFVDEAGFMTDRRSGGYVDEAIKEFVRYMELYPDVTVIFAMYPHEAKEFLKLDAGITSRISRFVEFSDYSNEELACIAEEMLAKKGYTLDAAAKEAVKEYMETMRKEQRKLFGNAREVRRVIESAIVVASKQHYEEKQHGRCITEQMLRSGWERLEQKTIQSDKLFGFTTGGEKYGNQSNRL